MRLYPAIDVRGGGAVRLHQGDFSKETPYGDPLELARRHSSGGAEWLHVVDLDAAREGRAVNRQVITAIVRENPVRLQVGGGLRSEDDVTALLGLGVDRVVFGTAAVVDPALVRRCAEAFPGRVAVGLDYRRRADGALEAAVDGWREGSGKTVEEVLSALPGEALAAVVVTAIERDGTLGGPDLEGLAEVLEMTDRPVVASGGVASVEDLEALRRLTGPSSGRTLEGVVVGRALLDGRVALDAAMVACAASG